MAIDFNSQPYYDDFDKTKNYLRILFRPGYAVQARELTQLQTALQQQISSLGDFNLEHGSPVVGGNMFLDKEIGYVKIESSFIPAGTSSSVNVDNYYEEFLGRRITGITSGLTAIVIDVIAAEGNDPITLYVRYLNSGSDTITKSFAPEEEFISDSAISRKGKVQQAIYEPIGNGARFSIEDSVFYLNGHFVHAVAQSKIISKYDTYPTKRIAFSITESIVSSAEDISLTDNAIGTTNQSAPGANRYQIALDLVSEEYDFVDRTIDEMLQLMVVVNGDIKEKLNTKLGRIGDVIAQRTYEESGNYTLKPFMLNLREHYNNGSNGGLYTVPQLKSRYSISQDSDAITYGKERIAVGLEKSTAYVHGYRVQLENIKYIDLDKARDYDKFYNASIVARYGNYVYVNDLTGLPDIDNFTRINLLSSSSGVIGRARVRSIEYITGTIGTTGAVYRVYLFSVSMIGSNIFEDVVSMETDTTNGIGTVQFSATIDSANYGNTRYDTGSNSLIFPLPFSAVKTLANQQGNDDIDTTYVVKKTLTSSASSGLVQLNIVDGEFEPYNSTDWIVTSVSNGDIITVTDFSYPSDGDTNSYELTLSGSFTGSVKICALIRKTLIPKSKVLSTGVETQISVPARSNSLGEPDIYRLVSVVDDDGLDITDRYYLDNGQRDNLYDYGNIILKNQYDPADIVGPLTVVFDYFLHSTGDYFCVDSYSGAVDYEDIPSFQSAKGLVQLRDCIDFRPTMGDGETFSGAGGSTVDMVKPGSLIQSDISYYLPRKDKIYVDKYGNFGIVKGVSSKNPKLPEDPKDSMVLYNLSINAYTFGPSDITPTMIDHKRYTMRDIGKLENRIKNLEYFTTLSMLEKDAADYQNPNGTIKKGFMVDSFYGHNVGYASHPDYSCSIDRANGILRPQFAENNVRIAVNEVLTNSYATDGSANYRITGPLLTLDYTEVDYISQPYASYSEYVNPYAIYNFTGRIVLSPDTDNWKDTETRPEVVIDNEGIYDSFVQLAEEAGVIGTIWNEWQVNWAGEPVITRQITTSGGITTSSTIETVNTSVSRSGIRTTITPDTVQTVLGNRVIEVNFIPFIRSRIVSFNATGMKPNTTVYAYFDEVNITDFATATDQFYQYSDFSVANEFYTSSYNFNGSESWPSDTIGLAKTDLVTNSNGELSGFFVIPNNTSTKFKVGQRIFRLTDSEDNIQSDTTTSAEAVYEAAGLLEVQENLVLSTRTPQIERTAVTQQATAIIVNTTTVTTAARVNAGWVDPLAQTIMVDESGGIFATSLDLYFSEYDPTIPVTIYLVTTNNGIPTSTVIPFSEVTKTLTNNDISDDASVETKFEFSAPIHLQQGVEYAIIVKSMSDQPRLWVSEVGQYDVTVPAYKISKQPYSGSFFTSQNASTWTPDQNKDLKFTLNRAEFNTEDISEIHFQNVNHNDKLIEANPIETTDASTTVRVYHKMHGMWIGSTVRLSGITESSEGSNTVNGVPLDSLNKSHTITLVEENFYEFVVSVGDAATASGRSGGNTVFATYNIMMELMYLQSQQLTLPKTSIDWKTKTTSGRSTAGSEAIKQLSNTFYSIIPNENILFSRPQMIPSDEESITPGLRFLATLSSTSSKLSPVIDLERLSTIAVHNIINNPTDQSDIPGYNYVETYIEDTASRDTSSNCSYISRKVMLPDNADRIRVIMSVNRPSHTSIEVYYKVQSDDDIDFDSMDWILHAPETSIPYDENPDSYHDVEYDITPGQEFSSMAFKIVLKSSNNCYVPTVKDLRAISFFTYAT